MARTEEPGWECALWHFPSNSAAWVLYTKQVIFPRLLETINRLKKLIEYQ